MKKLITNIAGGFPFVLDDLGWLQDGLTEAIIHSMSQYFSGNPYIISGCEDDGSNISPGWIFFKSQILQFDGAAYTAPLDPGAHFTIQTTYDPAGLKTLQNNSTVDTYEVKKAVFSNSTTIGVHFPLIGAYRLQNINRQLEKGTIEIFAATFPQMTSGNKEGFVTAPATKTLDAGFFLPASLDRLTAPVKGLYEINITTLVQLDGPHSVSEGDRVYFKVTKNGVPSPAIFSGHEPILANQQTYTGHQAYHHHYILPLEKDDYVQFLVSLNTAESEWEYTKANVTIKLLNNHF